MEWNNIGNKTISLFTKYRYVVLILVIGLAMMLLPTGRNKENKNDAVLLPVSETEQSLQTQLEQLLTTVHGAGAVKVLLSTSEGEQVQYQTDTDITNREGDATQRVTTVTITDGERNQNGLIKQVNPPKYQGAVVVCDGADDPSVQLAIAEAVSKITGLGLNRISVLKMK